MQDLGESTREEETGLLMTVLNETADAEAEIENDKALLERAKNGGPPENFTFPIMPSTEEEWKAWEGASIHFKAACQDRFNVCDAMAEHVYYMLCVQPAVCEPGQERVLLVARTHVKVSYHAQTSTDTRKSACQPFRKRWTPRAR